MRWAAKTPDTAAIDVRAALDRLSVRSEGRRPMIAAMGLRSPAILSHFQVLSALLQLRRSPVTETRCSGWGTVRVAYCVFRMLGAT